MSYPRDPISAKLPAIPHVRVLRTHGCAGLDFPTGRVFAVENVAGTNHRVCFKGFELDPLTRELYRNGIRLHVQGQPIDVLQMLLERPGELVTREQLQKKLWPQDTFVDFEHSLNSAVTRLREALGDKAESPKFIETLPRMGYRFVAPVANGENGTPISEPIVDAADHPTELAAYPLSVVRPQSESKKADLGSDRGNGIRASAAVAVVLCGAALVWYIRQPLPPPSLSETVRLTSDVRWSGKLAIGADATRIFLRLEGTPPELGQVAIEGGEIGTIPIPVPGLTRFGAVSPAGDSVLVCGKYDPNDNMSELWVAGIMGSPIRYLSRAFCTGRLASWSPDGKQVVYTTSGGELYTIPAIGGEPHLLRKLAGEAALLAYSPDGSRIRFSYRDEKLRGIWRIWEMSSQGQDLHEVLPGWHPKMSVWNGRWTLDGDFFIFLVTDSALRPMIAPLPNQIWVIDERRGVFRRENRTPVQLTSGLTTWSNPIPSIDGKKIFTERYEFRGELVRYDRGSRQVVPYLGGKSAEMLDFSRDGKFLIYKSFPSNVLWRANRDGSGIQQIAKAPHLSFESPQISPDGTQIVFSDSEVRQDTETSSIFRVSSNGGTPVPILVDDTQDEYSPSWSPDGTKVVFHSRTYWQTRAVDPNSEVRIVDLATRKVTYLPAPPKRSRYPRWSPDGRYIVCLTLPGQFEADDGLEVYDLRKSKWEVILQGKLVEWPTWSNDGRWIYFISYEPGGHTAFYRIPPSGGAPELTGHVEGIRSTGFFWGWAGFDPDGNPLMLRDAGTDEIYALTLDRQ